ncbi:hypothetical protein [Nocardia sp. NPDC052566]|uniref:hypothetical protein n=1 Tax=Nocardia sp. NPDC052566 TaxID=3364330 RepID=UPI0037C7EC00
MSAIPVSYPVTMTDGTDEYEVFDATSYVNAVYSLGHRQAETTAAPAATGKHARNRD